jgi:HPt (histidine-containing phosphotransfer) domain-containing protein
MSQRELALRFLTRTRSELTQMTACLPDEQLPIEPLALAHLERMAGKISSSAEAFGFPEIGVIAGAIELLSQVAVGRTVRERLELTTRLGAQLSALEVHIEYELAEREIQDMGEDLPMSAALPGFRAR